MVRAYEKPEIATVGDFTHDTAFTHYGNWIDVLGWWF